MLGVSEKWQAFIFLGLSQTLVRRLPPYPLR